MKRILRLLFVLMLACSISYATVTDQTQKVQSTASADQTVFTYTWRILDEDDLDVFIDGVITTAYSVSGVGELAGGSVTFNSGRTSGEVITILRNMPLVQDTDYPAGGRLSTVNLEKNLDELMMISQDLQEEVGRATKTPGTSTVKDIDFPIGTSATDRASKVPAWNSAGTALELVSTTSITNTDPIASQGDLVIGDSSGGASKLAIGNAGEILEVVATSTLKYEKARNIAWRKGSDIIGTAALAVPDENANYFDVTGSPNVTTIAATNLDVGSLVRFHFDSSATLTHDATNLVLPGSATLTVTAGDEFTFIQYDTDDYRLVATTSTVATGLAVHTHADATQGGNTLTAPTIASFTNATHDHANAAGGGNTLVDPILGDASGTSLTLTGTTETDDNTVTSRNIIGGWTQFEGAGAPSATAGFDYNVTSYTDHAGEGDYSIVWNNDFASAAYAIAGATDNNNGGDWYIVSIAAGSARIFSYSTNNVATGEDKTLITIIAVGPQ